MEDRLPGWSPPVQAALQVEAEIRGSALAAVTDESENSPSAEYKLKLAAIMIEASRAFSAFDDDAYVDAVSEMKDLLGRLPETQ